MNEHQKRPVNAVSKSGWTWSIQAGEFHLSPTKNGISAGPLMLAAFCALVIALLPMKARIAASTDSIHVDRYSLLGIPISSGVIPRRADAMVSRRRDAGWMLAADIVSDSGSRVLNVLPVYVSGWATNDAPLLSVSRALTRGEQVDGVTVWSFVAAMPFVLFSVLWVFPSTVELFFVRYNLIANRQRVSLKEKKVFSQREWDAITSEVSHLREENANRMAGKIVRHCTRWFLVMNDGRSLPIIGWGRDDSVSQRWSAFCALADHLGLQIAITGENEREFDFASISGAPWEMKNGAVRMALSEVSSGIRAPGTVLYTLGDSIRFRQARQVDQ